MILIRLTQSSAKASSLRVLVSTVILIIQCCDGSLVGSSHQLQNSHRHTRTTNATDNGDSKTVLPVWVIIVIVLLILMALCFCTGLCYCRFAHGKRYYGDSRRNNIRRRIRVVRVTSSGINHENFRGTEQTGVSFSGENPINNCKEADTCTKQLGQTGSTLYQSEAPPKYEDVVQLKSTELDEILLVHGDQHCGPMHHKHSAKSPPPSYQCVDNY